jgi:GNAT superfamily N-acetyltransferase
MMTDADLAAQALHSALRLIVRAMPGMRVEPAGGGVYRLVTGMPVVTLNGVFTEAEHPDEARVAAAAAQMTGLDLPWCIQFRGEPGPEAGKLARQHGLAGRAVIPLMLLRGALGQRARESALSRVRLMSAAEQPGFAASLAAGFEIPLETLGPFTAPEFLAAPGVVPYLAEEDGQVVSVGLGLFSGEFAGVFNIATLPDFRGRGYGRAVTQRIVTDGIARGAHLAYLQPSPPGYPIYASMGFRTVENWTYLVPA